MNKELLEKYISGECNESEKQIVESWYEHYSVSSSSPYEGDDKSLEKSAIRSYTKINEQITSDQSLGNDFFDNSDKKVKHITMSRKWSWTIAAAVVLVVGFIWTTYRHSSSEDAITMNDVLPGKNKAILHLSDGRSIDLNDVDQNIELDEAGIEIKKNKTGELIYVLKNTNQNSTNAERKVIYNTISTPRSGRYAVILPDGSKVTLNAESKITYPVPFDLNERRIELLGEAFFEVAKMSIKNQNGTPQRVPFIIYAGDQRIQVLGTSFNINAYANEHKTVTTLIDGKVDVALKATPTRRSSLTPGFSAVSDAKGLSTELAHLESVVAWKNNFFYFNDQHISTIMRAISRWYDVDFVLEKDLNITDLYFSGSVSNDKSLSQVLRIMERTGTVKFIIEGRRVIVMN